MDSIGDYIYIIVIIIAAISSIAGKRKNKVIATNTERQFDVPKTGDLFEEIYQSVPKDNKDFWSDVSTDSFVPSYDTVEDISVLKAKKQVKQSKPPKKAEPVEIEVANDVLGAIDLSDTEEIKKAVLYAEILNRKY
ncbi:hypothetical protein MASR2M117_25010 [Paludibacter sp.]